MIVNTDKVNLNNRYELQLRIKQPDGIHGGTAGDGSCGENDDPDDVRRDDDDDVDDFPSRREFPWQESAYRRSFFSVCFCPEAVADK